MSTRFENLECIWQFRLNFVEGLLLHESFQYQRLLKAHLTFLVCEYEAYQEK